MKNEFSLSLLAVVSAVKLPNVVLRVYFLVSKIEIFPNFFLNSYSFNSLLMTTCTMALPLSTHAHYFQTVY